MGSDNAKVRRLLAWTVFLVVVIVLAGWFAYREISESRRLEAAARQDADNLQMFRYQDVLEDLESIGNSGDDATRARCRHAIQLLALMEPSLHNKYRSLHPAPAWLSEAQPEKK